MNGRFLADPKDGVLKFAFFQAEREAARKYDADRDTNQ